MPTQQTAAPAPVKLTPQQQDSNATRMILATAIDRSQVVAQQTVYPAANPTLLIQPQNVGLVKRFRIIVSGTINNTGGVPITLTDFGLANIFGLGGVQYIDLNNYLRVNTSGMHLTLLANAKRRSPYGGTYQTNTLDGNNLSQVLNVPPAYWPVYTATNTIAAGANAPFRVQFELPLAYSDSNLTGAIWANVLTAVQQLTLTFNPQVVTANPNDNTFAVYSGAAGAAGSISSATVVVYQEYLDQLPKALVNGQLTTVLPAQSLSTVYELKNTTFQAIAENQEFQIAYANQRAFISTALVFNDNGTYNGRQVGSDVNYFALSTANAAYIWKNDPLTCAAISRDELGSDLPAGMYYFPTRRKNIGTAQYGNMQLVLNANFTNASAYMNVMWEAFATLNTLTSGPSLAS